MWDVVYMIELQIYTRDDVEYRLRSDSNIK